MEWLYGKPLAEKIKTELAHLRETTGETPGLAFLFNPEDAGSISYLKAIQKNADNCGVKVYCYPMPADASQKEYEEILKTLAADDKIDGILLGRPLANNIPVPAILPFIPDTKDIEGITYSNTGKLYEGEKAVIPCTAEAVMEILKGYGIELEGKKAVVLGRSNTVGKPAAQLLLKENCTVTICHRHTYDLADEVKRADILVAAMGQPHFVQADWIKENATVIDVGANRDKDGKLCGDVDTVGLSDRNIRITPVPGGVGALTSVLLMRHVWQARLAHLQEQERSKHGLSTE